MKLKFEWNLLFYFFFFKSCGILFYLFRRQMLQNTLSPAALQIIRIQQHSTLGQLMANLDLSQIKDCTPLIWINFTYKTGLENSVKLTGYTFEEHRCPNDFLLIPNTRWIEFDFENNNWDLILDCRSGEIWRP